jgi:hypothetical protein
MIKQTLLLETPLNTAVDFRARFRFPRVTREPPRRCAPVGSHISHFSRRSLRLPLQSTAGTGKKKQQIFT